MDYGPLVKEEIEAGAELLKAFSEFAPVSVAFWLRVPDEQERYLYIASDAVDFRNFNVAIGKAMQLADEIAPGVIDPFRVRVVWRGDQRELAEAVRKLAKGEPDTNLPLRRFGGRLGDVSYEDLYLYPPLQRTHAA